MFLPMTDLHELIEDYAENGSPDIFYYLRDITPDKKVELFHMEMHAKDLEHDHSLPGRDLLIYHRRLIASIASKKQGQVRDRAYNLDRAGKAAWFWATKSDEIGARQEWFRRAGSLRYAAFRLFKEIRYNKDSVHALGFAGVAYVHAGHKDKGKELIERSLAAFQGMSLEPGRTLADLLSLYGKRK